MTYLSFMLRVWRESDQGNWRASLEQVTTGERHGFADLSELFAYILTCCADRPASTISPMMGANPPRLNRL